MGNISSLDWVVIAIYMIVMIALGWRAGRKNKTLEDYFVGGRNMGAFAAGISLLATLLSSVSYLSAPGEVIANGTGFLFSIIAMPVVFVVIGYFLIPHIMATPVNSAYELLETRLGARIRALCACLFMFIRLLWMGMILHTCATATSIFTGLSREGLILALGVITLIYTAEGGIRAVIWTDVAQFFILLGGAFFTVIFLMHQSHFGVTGLAREMWERAANVPVISLDPTLRISVLSIAFSDGLWWIATCGSDQVAMQRFFTTRDASVARRSLLVNLVANVIMLLALASIGITLLHYYTAQPQRLPAHLQNLKASGDKIFPWFIVNGLPMGLCGMVIAALFAAAMSSLSSGFNSITTVLTVDFLQRGDSGRSGAATAPNRRGAQMMTVVIGLVVMGLGLLIPLVGGNFFELANRLLNPLTGPLFGLFALAFFDRKASSAGAWTGLIVGIATAFLIAFGHCLIGQPRPFSFALIMPGSIVVTIVAGVIASRIQSARATHG
ncbi:MAG: sodium/solute symporter [Verrucomicrobia bacterium]|nr:sodium/solute symporter [Verrucomicrobiota bacterium]